MAVCFFCVHACARVCSRESVLAVWILLAGYRGEYLSPVCVSTNRNADKGFTYNASDCLNSSLLPFS